MATTITAGNATNGAAVSSDNTGILELKTGTGSGTTALTLGTTGNVNFPISGQRITGDFTNATVANRVMFQTSTSNSLSRIGVIPSGSGQQAHFEAFNNSDPTNSSLAGILCGAAESRVYSGAVGTGTALPMTFYTNGSEKLRIAADATGTYTFGGTAPRITGDFSNATVTSRVLFQTSTTDNVSNISVIPNGTSTSAAFTAYNNSNPTDAGLIQIASLSADSRITAGRASVSGTYLPMTFYTGGSERARIDTSGNFQFNSGYGSVATAYGCRAWVNFNGTAAGTFAGGTSTVTRVAGSTTATVTTTTAHGLITGNQVYALTGVAAGAYTITYISDTSFSFTTVATTALTNASITFAVNSIRASGNVSSVADNGTGDYTVNFTTAMPDANYAVNGFTIKASSAARGGCFINYDVDQNSSGTAPATTSIRVINRIGTSITDGNGGAIDSPYVSIGIFR